MFPNFTLPESDCVSLYACLENDYGIILKDAVENISAVSATFIESQILHVPVNSPLLQSKRITYTYREPFEYALSRVVADRYEYQIYLSGRN